MHSLHMCCDHCENCSLHWFCKPHYYCGPPNVNHLSLHIPCLHIPPNQCEDLSRFLLGEPPRRSDCPVVNLLLLYITCLLYCCLALVCDYCHHLTPKISCQFPHCTHVHNCWQIFIMGHWCHVDIFNKHTGTVTRLFISNTTYLLNIVLNFFEL